METISQLRELICKGCANSINGNEGCTVLIEPINMFDKPCPCSTCVIKMMCRFSCEKFDDYTRTPSKKLIRGKNGRNITN